MFWCALPARSGATPVTRCRHRDWRYRHLGVEESLVDRLAFAGSIAMTQCREDRDGRIEASEEIGDSHADLLRTAPRRIVGDLVAGRPGDAHEATHALDGVVVAGALTVGAGLAEAG